jgi:hypothetical protein
VAENGEALFDSTLQLERRPWTARSLRDALLRFPWVTAKTIAAIHWEAARLFLKKVPLFHHPGPGRFTPVNQRHMGASRGNK